MKKLLLSLIFILFLIPTVVLAEEKIEIKSITFVEKSENTKINTEASTDGEKINLDLTFYDKDDYATYKVVVNNPNDVGLYINDEYFNYDKKYISYEFVYNEGNNFIKANEEKEFTLKVRYKTEVDKSLFRSAKYDASSVSPLIFSNQLLKIPNTLKNLGMLGVSLVVITSVCILIGVYVLIKNKKSTGINVMLLLFFLLLLIPNTVNALLKVEIPIDSKITIKQIKDNPCIFEGNLTRGTTYVNGQYTYTYEPTVTSIFGDSSIINVTYENGWGVVLTDKNSTEAVTTKLCTTINDKPIVSMFNMFRYSKAESIDLSSFDTSNVINMDSMFYNLYNVKELDVSTFDTSKVVDMNGLFCLSKELETIDGLTSFDTSNVLEFGSPFGQCYKVKSLNLSTFELGHIARNKLWNFLDDTKGLREIYTPKSILDTEWYNFRLFNVFIDDDENRYFYLTQESLNKRLVYFEDSAVLISGSYFKTRVKSLAGDTSQYGDNTTIRKVIRSFDRPSDDIINDSNHDVSNSYANYKVYAWIDNDILYLYSEAPTIYFAPFANSSFSSFKAIDYIDLKNIRMDFIKDASSMFSNVGGINGTVTLDGIEDAKTTNIREMDYMFNDFSTNYNNKDNIIINLDLSKWDTSNVTNVDCMFYGMGSNSKEIKLDLHGLDFSKLTKLGDFMQLLGQSANKVDIDMSNIKFGNLTDIHYSLAHIGQESQQLKINVTGWDVSKVTNANNLFYYTAQKCPDFTLIGVKDWKTTSLTDAGGMFYGMAEDTLEFELDLSDWDVSKVTNMYNMFKGFARRANNAKITLKNWVLNPSVSSNYLFYYTGDSAKNVEIDLTGWDLSGRENIGSTLSGMGGSSNLNIKLNLSNWNTTGLKSIANMFNYQFNSANKVVIDLTGWDTSQVTDMSGMFNSCGNYAKELEIIGLNDLDYSSVTNMSNMFKSTGGLKLNNFRIGNVNTSNMFNGAQKLSGSILITDNITTYSNMLYNANSYSEEVLTVNYKAAATNIDDIMATKGDSNNVIKGSLIED